MSRARRGRGESAVFQREEDGRWVGTVSLGFDAKGKPIQGSPGRASFAHEPSYADYSHGVRMVSGTMTIDWRTMSMQEAMRDPVLSKAVSNEGPIRNPRIPGVPR